MPERCQCQRRGLLLGAASCQGEVPGPGRLARTIEPLVADSHVVAHAGHVLGGHGPFAQDLFPALHRLGPKPLFLSNAGTQVACAGENVRRGGIGNTGQGLAGLSRLLDAAGAVRRAAAAPAPAPGRLRPAG